MKYSIEPKDLIYFKGYGFLCFAKNFDKSLSMSYKKTLKLPQKGQSRK